MPSSEPIELIDVGAEAPDGEPDEQIDGVVARLAVAERRRSSEKDFGDDRVDAERGQRHESDQAQPAAVPLNLAFRSR